MAEANILSVKAIMVCKLLPVFIFLVPGMIAFALNQKGLINLGVSDAAFPVLIATLLPAGVKGIVVGGLLAALMSSLASLFNSSSALFTVDFYKKYKPEASEKQLVIVGRLATVVVVILGIIWIPIMKSVASVLYEYLQNVQSLLAPAIAATFMMGVFSKKATGKAGFYGLVIGFALGMFRLSLMVFQNYLTPGGFLDWIVQVNWLHYCIFLFLLSAAIIWVTNKFTLHQDEDEIKGLVYGLSTKEQIAETRASWNKWDVIHTSVIVSAVAAFYIYFW